MDELGLVGHNHRSFSLRHTIISKKMVKREFFFIFFINEINDVIANVCLITKYLCL
jgi:hypothetical protein